MAATLGKGETVVKEATSTQPGCPFHPQCPRAVDRCAVDVPPDHKLGFGRTSKCHFAEELVSRT